LARTTTRLPPWSRFCWRPPVNAAGCGTSRHRGAFGDLAGVGVQPVAAMQGDMALPANMAWGEWRSLPRVFAAAQPLLQRGQALQGLPGLTALAHTAGAGAGAVRMPCAIWPTVPAGGRAIRSPRLWRRPVPAPYPGQRRDMPDPCWRDPRRCCPTG
jgi:hypothetical protein